MRHHKITLLSLLMGVAISAPAQVKTDSAKFEERPIDVGASKTFKRSESTAAVSVITSDETNRRSDKNIATSIIGQGLGLVSLQSTGSYADKSASFLVRGLQSLSGSTPLILVDGVERPIDNITPEEVERVSVLKDAAAVALYGYRGTNGAILITTKRGKNQTRDIQVSFDHAINYLRNKPKFVDAATYASAVNEGRANDGLSARYTDNEIEAFRSGQYPSLYPNVNWMDETYRNHSVTNKVSAQFRGGGQRFRYYTLLNFIYDNGFVKNANENEGYSTNNKYSRGNLRINLDVDVTPTTLFKVNLHGYLAEENMPGSGSSLWSMIYGLPAGAIPVKTASGMWGGNTIWDGTVNPVAQSQGAAYSKNHERGLFSDFTLRQDLNALLPGLAAQARFAYDNISNIFEDHSKTYVYGSPVVTGWENGKPVNGDDYTGGTDSDMGTSAELKTFQRRTHFDVGLDYTRGFGLHTIYSQLRYDYDVNDNQAINSTYHRQNFSLYNHYGYNEKYYADLALVVAGSSCLAPGSKWAFSPTLSAAWVMSREDWMSDVNGIDFLKLRASAGIINSDVLPASGWFYYVQQYEISGGFYPFDNAYTSSYGRTALADLATTELRHEKAYKYNIGLDATLFGGLDVTLDAYHQHRANIWVSTAGASTAMVGLDAPYEARGIVNSWGAELGLDYNKTLGDVKLNIGGNLMYNKTKIVNQEEAPRLYDNLITTGHQLGQLYGLRAIGLFQSQEEIDNSPTQTFATVQPGDIKYEDINGDGLIDANDVTAIGHSTTPALNYSLHLEAEWRGLGFYALFQGVGKYSGFLSTKSTYRPLVNNTTISQYYYDNRWTPETAAIATLPRLSTENDANNSQNSTFWLADRSFFKLRNLEIYYWLPEAWVKKTQFMSKAKIYVRANDLLGFDHIDQGDAEAYGANHPLTSSIIAGIALTF